MNCPSCHRMLASTLSVCPSCGTMVHDSVREELALKISSTNRSERPVVIKNAPVVNPISKPMAAKNQNTTEIMTKTTSATLVDFQNKNATIPDWRLQLQNSVRKRLDQQNSDEQVVEHKPRRTTLVTNGATALKVEPEEKVETAFQGNPQLANALRRIEESRQKYLVVEAPEPQTVPVQQTSVRQFPQIIPNAVYEETPKQEFTNNVAEFSIPNIVPITEPGVTLFPEEVISKGAVTNKLPPLPPPAKISSSFEKRSVEEKKIEIKKIDIGDVDVDYIESWSTQKSKTPEVVAYSELEEIENASENEEAEDFAPVSLRFNSALFDLLICSFLSLVLLAPFMLLNGKFFSLEGFFAFLATCCIVMFIYLTTTIGFLGRTFGMRLFSLEIIDVEENAYPTLHQAAVSSSVYLLSLGLAGIGFLPMLLNSERRAAHDLISGTIIVKEY